MTRQELFQLERMASLTPNQLREQNAKIYSDLGRRAGINLRNDIKNRLGGPF